MLAESNLDGEISHPISAGRRRGQQGVDLGVRMLLHDPLRFAVTLTGVGFAVLLVLFTSGLVLGLLDRSTSVIEMLGADLWVTSRNTAVVDFPIDFPETRVSIVRSIPGVARADNLLVNIGPCKTANGGFESIGIYATENFAHWHLSPIGARARDLRGLQGVVLDGSMTGRRRIGDFRIGDYREIYGRRLKILGFTVGLSTFMTNPLAFMDYALFQSLKPDSQGQTWFVIVKLAPAANAAAVAAEIRRRLPRNDVFTSAQWMNQTRHYWLYRTGLGLDLGIDVLMASLVGIIVVAQSVYVSATEHLKEFGMIKAIGGSNWDIYRILLRHAYIYALGSYLLGYLAVLLIAPILRWTEDIAVVVDPALAITTLTAFTVMSAGAAMLSF